MSQALEGRENVVLVNFRQDSDAYEALTLLKELDSQDQVDLRAAAVVARQEDGHIEVKDQVGDRGYRGTATGGVIGLLIGIIAGPLGILIGGVTGLLIGSLYDVDDLDDAESVLSDISKSVRVGHSALLAEAGEQSGEIIDTAMARLDGTVVRRPLEDVEAEIAAAEDVQRAAKKHARKLLREQRHANHKAKIHAEIERLKTKLHGLEAAATPK
jgi:uncharacterized membrane protein